MFSCEIYEILKSTYFEPILKTSANDYFCAATSFYTNKGFLRFSNKILVDLAKLTTENTFTRCILMRPVRDQVSKSYVKIE